MTSSDHGNAVPGGDNSSRQGSQTPLVGRSDTHRQSGTGESSTSSHLQNTASGSKDAQTDEDSAPENVPKDRLVIALQRLEAALDKVNAPKKSESDDDIGAELAVKWLEEFLPTVIQVAMFGASIVFTVVVTDSGTSTTSTDTSASASNGTSNGTSNTTFQKSGFVTEEQAKLFSALAWLFFVVALGFAGIAYVAVTVNRPMLVIGFKEDKVDDEDNGYEAQKKKLKREHGNRVKKPAGRQAQQEGDDTLPAAPKIKWWKWKAVKSFVWMWILRFALWVFVKFPFSETVQMFVLGAFVFLSLVVVAYNEQVGYAALAFTGLTTFVVGSIWLIHVLVVLFRLLVKIGGEMKAGAKKVSSCWKTRGLCNSRDVENTTVSG